MDMKDRLALLHTSIDLELNVSGLYMLYCHCFSRDAAFWWQLSMEEKNHAALLRSGEEYISLGKFPDDLLFENLNVIRTCNADITKRIARYEQDAPSGEEAYAYALEIENSAAELHFQNAMASDSESEIMQIFQRLCGDDKEHAKRIRSLMKYKGFSLPG